MNRISKLVLPAIVTVVTILAVTAVASLIQARGAASVNAQTNTATPAPTTVGPTPVSPTAAAPVSGTLRTDIGATGTGRVNVTPDTAVASIGVEITATTLVSATQESNETMTAVLDAIKAQGIDAKDIQTSNYNVFPLTNNPKEGESPTVTAYRVSNLVTVKIRNITTGGNEKVGAVLDAALGAGANSINSVFFTVDDPTQAKNDARELAVKDAMAKAQTLATAAGVELGAMFSISEVTGNVIPFYRGGLEAAQGAGGAGPVETGSTEVSVTVEIHYEIAQ